MANTVITIARHYGSGGRTVGKMLAERLGIHYYDNELIKLLLDEFENNCGGVIGYMPDRIEAILRRLKGMEDADED